MKAAVKELVKAVAANGGSLSARLYGLPAEQDVVAQAETLGLIAVKPASPEGDELVLTTAGWDSAREWVKESPARLRGKIASRVKSAGSSTGAA
jgi:hypothetical protein